MKYSIVKMAFLGLPLDFPPKKLLVVNIPISANSTRLKLSAFEFFSGFCSSFDGFLGLSFSRNVRKKLECTQMCNMLTENRTSIFIWRSVCRWEL